LNISKPTAKRTMVELGLNCGFDTRRALKFRNKNTITGKIFMIFKEFKALAERKIPTPLHSSTIQMILGFKLNMAKKKEKEKRKRTKLRNL
jgi:hypothetical protein